MQSPARSTLVSVVVWVLIVLSGFAVFISILQNIMLFVVFDNRTFNQAMQQQDAAQMPAMAAVMLNTCT